MPDLAAYTALGFGLGDSPQEREIAARLGLTVSALAHSGSTRYRETSSHFLKIAPKKRAKTNQEKSRDSRLKEIHKRAVKAELLDRLKDLATGAYGPKAAEFAEKWIFEVARCPGSFRRHDDAGADDPGCGRPNFSPRSCRFRACPNCQAKRASMARAGIQELMDRGLLNDAKFWTLELDRPRPRLTSALLKQLSKAFARLWRRKGLGNITGGVRSFEVPPSQLGGWFVHIHALLNGGWMPHYDMWDIVWTGTHWKVVKKHKGLARLWTEVCQKFSELCSLREDFNIRNPDHWYFVDLKRADSGAAAEVAKYIAKGSEVVAAGAGALWEWLQAVKGRRMIQGFGSLYNVVDADMRLSDDADLEPDSVERAAGVCPYDDCPNRHGGKMTFISYDIPVTTLDVIKERDAYSGTYRVYFKVPDE